MTDQTQGADQNYTDSSGLPQPNPFPPQQQQQPQQAIPANDQGAPAIPGSADTGTADQAGEGNPGGLPTTAGGIGQAAQGAGQAIGGAAKRIVSYLSGQGAMGNDDFIKAQKDINPDNTMDPGEVNMRIAASGSAGFQAVQARYNAQIGSAALALNQHGNLKLATEEASKASDFVPDGSKITYTPAKGGGGVDVNVHTMDGQDQKFNLTPEQFNGALKGPSSLFNTHLEANSANVIKSLQQSGGIPIKPVQNQAVQGSQGPNDQRGGPNTQPGNVKPGEEEQAAEGEMRPAGSKPLAPGMGEGGIRRTDGTSNADADAQHPSGTQTSRGGLKYSNARPGTIAQPKGETDRDGNPITAGPNLGTFGGAMSADDNDQTAGQAPPHTVKFGVDSRSAPRVRSTTTIGEESNQSSAQTQKSRQQGNQGGGGGRGRGGATESNESEQSSSKEQSAKSHSSNTTELSNEPYPDAEAERQNKLDIARERGAVASENAADAKVQSTQIKADNPNTVGVTQSYIKAMGQYDAANPNATPAQRAQRQIDTLDQIRQVGGAARPAAAAAQTIPPAAVQHLKEGVPMTFSNGQQWMLRNGQPVQVK